MGSHLHMKIGLPEVSTFVLDLKKCMVVIPTLEVLSCHIFIL